MSWIQPGELKEHIEILTPAPVTGPVIPFDPEYDVHATAKAKVEFPRGNTFWAAKAVSAETTAIFTLRYRKDITPEMKIRYDGKIHDIEAILPEKTQKRYLTVHAKEVQDVG